MTEALSWGDDEPGLEGEGSWPGAPVHTLHTHTYLHTPGHACTL